MQESTKKTSFIPATHFYNDFKRIYNAKGNTGKQAKAIRHSIIPTRSAHIYTAYSYHPTTIYRKYANFIHILLVFSYIYCNFATTNE